MIHKALELWPKQVKQLYKVKRGHIERPGLD